MPCASSLANRRFGFIRRWAATDAAAYEAERLVMLQLAYEQFQSIWQSLTCEDRRVL
jgi:hypothetical protein